ncbi:50S ribosomal protein L13 [Bythopirellula goksoeyrii]|uniref:Large ribosomal subunit protein uL13 n=1 Tax=Bythopirellula goksoeyrii TaxID=1400387 RepID=A0A5B9Q3V1_9BACT|nr:50S ribosomal protein L13 [Bythopirellula goksoeyrii]QEG33667.1 50S ribosomal protein L13 [Bythopirellula goksoeyrii]
MKTYMAKAGEVEQKWLLVDATDKIVGRLASEIAMILMGKHRPTYTPHVDTGDYVVVVNAEKIAFTGKKWENKKYAWYTGYTRQRTVTAGVRLEKKPELILEEAVRRMLPKNKLARNMLSKLKIYAGTEHPHTAQQPEPTELAIKA